jgi:hypothetical protein
MSNDVEIAATEESFMTWNELTNNDDEPDITGEPGMTPKPETLGNQECARVEGVDATKKTGIINNPGITAKSDHMLCEGKVASTKTGITVQSNLLTVNGNVISGNPFITTNPVATGTTGINDIDQPGIDIERLRKQAREMRKAGRAEWKAEYASMKELESQQKGTARNPAVEALRQEAKELKRKANKAWEIVCVQMKEIEQHGTGILPDVRSNALHSSIHLNHVVAIHLHAFHPITDAFIDELLAAELLIARSAEAVAVVLDNEDHGQVPHGCHVETLVKIAFAGTTVTREHCSHFA